VGDGAGFCDDGADVGDSAQHALAPERGGEDLVLVDAVLQRYGRRAGDARHRPRRLFGVPQLHCHHHQVRRARLRRVIHDLHAKLGISQLAADPQPAPSHGLGVRAPRDERHLVAGLLQTPAVVPADAAAPHHHDLHGRMLG